MHIGENIPSKFLKIKFESNIESICVDVNLRKWTSSINFSCNFNKSFTENDLECLNCVLFSISVFFHDHS